MSFDLTLDKGDIKIDKTGRVSVVKSNGKLRQDIIKILEAYISLYQNYDKDDDRPAEPDRDLQKYESARDIQRRFRGNRQRRQLTKKAHRYGKMYGPATRKETMRRWIDLSKQFDGDDVVGYLDPFSKKGGKKKRRSKKKKRRKTKKKKSKKKKTKS